MLVSPSHFSLLSLRGGTTIKFQQAQLQVMATSLTSNPWHSALAFLITATVAILQMDFHSSSPLDEHPASIWICIISLLFYSFAFGYHERCQSDTSTNVTSLNRCVKIAFISGSLAYTALISVLVRPSLQPLVFVVWLILLLVYFNHKKITEITRENMASYFYDLWRRTQSRTLSLYEKWGRTECSNVPAISLPPV